MTQYYFVLTAPYLHSGHWLIIDNMWIVGMVAGEAFLIVSKNYGIWV